MALSSARWKRYAETRFAHEREGLEYLRDNLPDTDPVFLFSNFEFIGDDGSVNEVDALVVTRAGLFLVELKSRGGKITGNRHTWFWEKDGRTVTIDSPLILTNSKAKKLGDILARQKAFRGLSRPYVEALVFCSDPSISIQLAESERMRICARLPLDKAPGIIPALLRREAPGLVPLGGTVIDRPMARAILQALEQAGIRHSQRERRVGDYVLGSLIEENALLSCQDFAAEHPATKAHRRVRLYNIAGVDAEARERLKQAALREYLILDGLDHPGILKALEFKEHELGPALVFRRDEDEVRFDHYLAQQGNRLTLDQKLDFVRQLTEALRYAHGRRIVHRALMPRSILVTGVNSGKPQLRIFNWQLGRPLGTGSGTTTVRSATLHPNQIADGSQLVYVAPEALSDPRGRGETMDVFSLGAIAYHIFSGKPPALSLPERDQVLLDGDGFRIAAVLDGAAPELAELIHESTRPGVMTRTESVADFLQGLDRYEEQITKPEEEPVAHPLEAKCGDTLEGGLLVKQRLGGGSAAIALLVEKEDRELVLKIARKAEDNERLLAEHRTLVRLRHPRIVAPEPEPLTIDGLAGFLMERAGAETLAVRLQREGRLSLDLLQRFGEDLLTAIEYLEEQGVSHRDLKPDNIGIAEYGKNHELHLKLFDFSLSSAPLDQIRAGTPPYLEPFLALKQRGQRWDTAAERFAAAMVLYEMAAGTLPYWGDKQSAPHLVQCEATIEAELIDAPVRESLHSFFDTALRRNPAERFDNATDMLAAWHSAFAASAATESKLPDPNELRRGVSQAALSTSLQELPLGNRARNALERLGALTVETVLRQPPTTFFNLRGVGNKTRREIFDLLALLRERFPETAVPERAAPSAPAEAVETAEEGAALTVDAIVAQLLPVARYKADQGHRERLLLFLELEDGRSDGPRWPTQTDVAKRAGKTRALVGQDLTRARERWKRTPALTAVRREIAEFLAAQGGIATAMEIAKAILSARHSDASEPQLALRRASAVVRAALETERAADSPQWDESRAHGLFLVALNKPEVSASALFQYAFNLAEAARQVAASDPLPAPARAAEALRAITPKPVELSENRLLRLASAAGDVSLSPRMELYPTSMPGGRALKLAQSALAGLDRLSVADVQKRVRERYPDAKPLPGRPELDDLMHDAGLVFTWNDAERLYLAPRPEVLPSSTSLHRAGTIMTPARPMAPIIDLPKEVQQAREFERMVRASYEHPSYLVLYTAPRFLADAERELMRRFPVDIFDFDAEVIAAMKAAAQEVGAQWPVVLRADAAPPESQDRRRLQQLFERALRCVDAKLRARKRLVLVKYPGLLARYGEISFLEKLSDGALEHGLWVLIAGDRQTGSPTLDHVPVPALGPNQAAEIPPAWIENRHRGGLN
jgi:serine/threonine protein kinase